MLRRSLFACALMLASVVGFASSAKAIDQPVTFTTTIDASCNLTTPATGSLNGTLIPNAGKDSLTSIGGTSAYVGVDCNNGKLKVGTPTLTSFPVGFTGTPTNTSKITSKSGQTATDTAGSEITLTATTDKGDAMVDMTSSLAPGTPFDAGNYSYTVVVTATP